MLRNLTLLLILLVNAPLLMAQEDTIRVQTLTYDSITTRRGWWSFPDESHSYRKVLMHQTLKCDAQTTQDGYACGEWDYLTYNQIHRHTGVLDSAALVHPYFLVGTTAPDSVDRLGNLAYDQVQRWEQHASVTQVGTGTMGVVGIMNEQDLELFDPTNNSTRSQFLYTAADLSAGGTFAGDPIKLIRLALNNATGTYRVTLRMKHASGITGRFDDVALITVYDATTQLEDDLQLTLATPFTWDGTNDLLVDIATEVVSAAAASSVLSSIDPDLNGRQQTGYDGYVDLKNDHVAIDPQPLAGIDNAITIMFRVFGAPEMPMNTTIFEALDADDDRILNIHLPWSNSRVYWDAGNDGTGYDRIDKAANVPDIKDQWNDWAFVKNTITGAMRIYLNGSLWHSGTGMTKPMQGISQIRIGAGVNGNYAYPGRLDEFNIFKTELSAADIATWHGRKVTASHPYHADLLYSYGFDEAVNSPTAADLTSSSSTAYLMGTVRRDAHRATELNSDPFQTDLRPNIGFMQGDHIIEIDSTLITEDRPGSLLSIVNFEVQGNEALPIDTLFRALGGWNYLLAPSGTRIDSTYNGGTMHYNDTLNYFGVPFEVVENFEIGRFITPYGINLSLGPQGFRWTYDVTDYQWLLHDSVELSAGNQQELIDLEFEMIEGTAPRSVVNHQRPWGNWGSFSYADLDNDVKFPPKTVQLDPTATQWSLRTRLTGHGHNSNTGNYPHCCEWKDNTHYVKVNGAEVDQWHIWQTNDCALNPVYPQGGTWLGSREGWCPGDVVKDHSVELTSFIAGSSVELDYDITPVPANNLGMGGGNYVINMDLLEYGDAAFAVDAEIMEIQRPSNTDYFRRDNPICFDPLIVLRNAGGTSLSSVTITYGVSGGTPLSHTWTGLLKHMQTALVALPVNDANFWIGDDDHIFTATVSAPNGGSDTHSANDPYHTSFELPTMYTTDVLLHYKTNNRPSENTVTVRDVQGVTVFNRSSHTANTTYIDTLHLTDGCYTLELLDTGNDGLAYWADTQAGTGNFRLKKPTGSTLKNFVSEFGRSIHFAFTIALGVGIDEEDRAVHFAAYPNPSDGNVALDFGSGQGMAQILVIDALGKVVDTRSIMLTGSGTHTIDLTSYANGLYQLRAETELGTGTLRLVKQ